MILLVSMEVSLLGVWRDNGNDMALGRPNVGSVIITDRPFLTLDLSVTWIFAPCQTLQCAFWKII